LLLRIAMQPEASDFAKAAVWRVKLWTPAATCVCSTLAMSSAPIHADKLLLSSPAV